MEDEDNEIFDDLFLLCRLCIAANGKFAIVPGTQIHKSINEIYGVKIEPYDGLSQLLCVSCKNKLMQILNLRATYITNQEILEALRTNHSKGRCDDIANEIKREPEDTGYEGTTNYENNCTPSPEDTETLQEIHSAQNISTNLQLPSSHVENLATNTNEEVASNHSSNNELDNKNLIDTTNLVDYEYRCRMCNDRFDSVFVLQDHAKSHSNLIRLQRRYTPYTCNVRLPRVMLDEDSDEAIIVDVREQSHPLFYIKRKTDKAIAVSESQMFKETEGGYSSDDNMGVESNLYIMDTRQTSDNNESKNEEDMDLASCSDTDDNRQTRDNHESEGEEDVDAVSGSLTDGTRLSSEVHDDSEREIKSESEQSMSVFTRTFSYNSKPIYKSDFEGIMRDDQSNFGAILREVNHILDEDVETKFNMPVVPEEQINKILEHRIEKYCQREEEVEIEQVRDLLLHLCKKGIKCTWREIKISPEIVLKYVPRKKSKKTHSNLHGFQVVNSNKVAKKSTGGATQLSKSSKRVNSQGTSANNVGEDTDREVVHSHNEVAKKSTASSQQINTNSSPNENNVHTNSSTIGQMLPVIVSTTTLEPSSAVADSTSVYIDLEDDQHTITSDQFPEPMTPIEFFKHVLKQESYYMSLERPSPQAVSLACFKKNVENRGDLIVSIYKDDNILYLEVCEGKANIDLSLESEITQWTVLTSLTQSKIETLMKNYAKRFSVNLDSLDKIIKIMRSISGVVSDNTVRLEAPKKYFFS